ncbi:unnamed protein product [Rotaria magnacalcarata]|uniref:Uncharacterized protein n=2 Tax=Rotaria magnacalcarata TaxID=392030 RepID=A0A816ZCZ1_9BILA|nr:unnamed protein product [Rotaria magnacalcarata]CAF4363788.1 unnamed protein product [Rotaria magnacalcarata]
MDIDTYRNLSDGADFPDNIPQVFGVAIEMINAYIEAQPDSGTFNAFEAQSLRIRQYISRLFMLQLRPDMRFLETHIIQPTVIPHIAANHPHPFSICIHLEFVRRIIAVRLLTSYMVVEFAVGGGRNVELLQDLLADIHGPVIQINLNNGSISSRVRNGTEIVSHYIDTVDLLMFIDVAYYEIPAPPPQDQDVVYELNIVENVADPLPILQDISGILNDSRDPDEEAMDDADAWSTIDDDENEPSVLIIEQQVEEPEVITIYDSDDDLCMEESYQEGDTTYLDVGHNDGFVEDPNLDESIINKPSDIIHELPPLLPNACSTPKPPDLKPCGVVDLNDALIEETYDSEATAIFISPIIAESVVEDYEAIDFRPVAASTPVPMEI